MKLLVKPATGKSRQVENFGQIREAARDMLLLLNAGGFQGKWHEGFALNHAQVDAKPFNFFVTHKSWEDVLPSIIINPRLIQAVDRQTFQEACLSFPFRDVKSTLRYFNVEVAYEVPTWAAAHLGTSGLKTEQQCYDGLAAYIFQHEIDHANGIDIYHK